MSKDKRKQVFNIAVVGLSGTEQIKGSSGVGKSCLCNRFVREEADAYYPDHTSVLSQSDFGGRVVNNDHFLYWGEVTKQDDNELDYKFNIIEQTEFIDDQSYQAHRSSSNQAYCKRSAQIKISSAEKMMYICTDQLGIESDFEAKPMSDGKLAIDGFVLCFDVSLVTNRSIDDQVKFIQSCYHYLAKTKKPILLALTKCDEAVPAFVKEGLKFAAEPGGKNSRSLLYVETSASENINVTLTFIQLAQMIDKTRSKSKVISFEDAAHMRKDILKDAKEQLESLLESEVTDYHETWQVVRRMLENKTQYLHYVELEGKNAASKIFRKHVNRLRDEYRLNLQNEYLRFFPRALKMILSDLSCVHGTWSETLQAMPSNQEFNNWIVSLEDLDNGGGTLPWYENLHMDSLEDRRIPSELLQTADAERYFLFHKQELETRQQYSEMKRNFRDMLSQSDEVTPGREWGHVAKFFKHDSIAEIPEAELSTIYDQFQAEIIEKAKENFQELLYEKSEIFVTSNNVTDVDIHDALKSDPRYTAMANLPKEKDEILTRHISEARYPPIDNWGAQSLAASLKSRRARLSRELPDTSMASPSLRWQLQPDSETLNVVLLGANGLSHELANEITVHSSDEYTLDGCIPPLRLRSIDGDVSLPANSFKTSSFSPHGCIAVYSSMESLNYVEASLEATVVSSSESPETENIPPFQGLPVSILLASYSNSEKEVHKLRDMGERLASRIGCPFIDVLAPEYAYNRRFHESQIRLAMKSLISGIKERAGSGRNSMADADRQAVHEGPSDLRIVMCTRKGDFQTTEIALAPLLNHVSFRDQGFEEAEGEETEDTVVVETYLGTQRRCIEITVTSYQCARNLLNKGSPIHGFIVVYDTTLKSSFSIMKVFSTNTASSYPLLILCISPNDKVPASKFFKQDVTSRQLIVDGNSLADKLHAKFVSASARHHRQTEVYSTFFKDAWEHKEDTESIHNINRVVAEEDDSSAQSVEPTLLLQKNSSMEQLATKPAHERSLESITPPRTLQFNTPMHNSDIDGQLEGMTPASTWSTTSEDFQRETPNTSPTAGLLDNEVNPDYSDFRFEAKPAPIISSHLYPGGASVQPSYGSTKQPGKLNQDLLNKVASGFRGPPVNLPDVFGSMRSTSDPPYMAIHDQPKLSGVRVLPSPVEATWSSKATSETKSEVKYSALGREIFPGSQRRPTGQHTKRVPLKSIDIDELTDHTAITARQMRHSTADNLSLPFSALKTETDGCGLSKRAFASSQEDLLHPTSLVPASISSAQDRSTPKEKAALKRKEEEKKRKEEKKNKEKEQRQRLKQKHAPRNPPASVAVGNKYNMSDYFNKRLDDIIQRLNHMVPRFPEECVQYIESTGLLTEGLYRIPANTKEREMIIKKFDEDNNYNLASAEASVHTVAGCLTWFFSHKNLPEPLIPSCHHDELEEAINMPHSSVRLLALRGIIKKLPYSNHATYKFICTHLKKVSDHSHENKMTCDNLAICWWNTLFRPDMDSTMPAAMPKTFYKDVLALCISQCDFMFYDKPEV